MGGGEGCPSRHGQRSSMHRVETPCYLFGSPPFPAASFALQGQSTGSCSPHGFSAVVVVGSVPTVTCVVTLHSFFLFTLHTHTHSTNKEQTQQSQVSLAAKPPAFLALIFFGFFLSLSSFVSVCCCFQLIFRFQRQHSNERWSNVNNAWWGWGWG